MGDARVLLAFAQLLVLALAFRELGVKSSLAPLCAVGGVVGVLTAFGCFGVLAAGGWVLAAASFILSLMSRARTLRAPLKRPGKQRTLLT